MNGVLAENNGRGDILLLRGITNRLAVKWERDQRCGGFEPGGRGIDEPVHHEHRVKEGSNERSFG